jgi:hypothetical protein
MTEKNSLIPNMYITQYRLKSLKPNSLSPLNIIKLKSLFVYLNALISGTDLKILSVLDSLFNEEDYRLWQRNTLISALHPSEAKVGR